MTAEFAAALEGRIKTIQALCNNPHWTSERRWRIAREADEMMRELKAQAPTPAPRGWDQVDTSTEQPDRSHDAYREHNSPNEPTHDQDPERFDGMS